jgi:hypothetical protein
MLSESACSVVDLAGNEPVIHNEYLISLNFRAMVDKLCFMAVYGSKTTLEARVPASIRAAFHKLTTDRHKVEGARDQFAAAWKAYLRANPTLDTNDENLAAEEALFAMLGADSDAEGGAAGGGADAEAATPPA